MAYPWFLFAIIQSGPTSEVLDILYYNFKNEKTFGINFIESQVQLKINVFV